MSAGCCERSSMSTQFSIQMTPMYPMPALPPCIFDTHPLLRSILAQSLHTASLHPRVLHSIVRIHAIMLPMQYLFQSALMMYRIAGGIILPGLPLLRLLIVLHLGQVRQLPLLDQVCLHLGGAVLRGNGGLRDGLRGCYTRRCALVCLWPQSVWEMKYGASWHTALCIA